MWIMFDTMMKPLGIVTAALVASTCLGGTAHAALLQSYDFDGTLSDTLDPTRSLSSLGGTVAGGRYVFEANQGLTLANALEDPTSYGIEIGLRITDSVGGYNKVIDFQRLTVDQGLYDYNGGLNLYSAGLTGGDVPLGSDVVLGLARDGENVDLYVDDTLVASGDDGGYAVPLENVLTFFVDDTRVAGESFAGSADFIRIHDGASSFGQSPDVIPPAPVPLPSSLPLLLAGLGMFAMAWQNRD